MDSTNDSGIKWGAEIAVDGKRPEFLDKEKLPHDMEVHWRTDGLWRSWSWYGFNWNDIDAIRLPADHPYYQKQASQAQPKVDWSKPIEAVSKQTGRVVPMKFLSGPDCEGDYFTEECPDSSETNSIWRKDGSDRCFEDKWFIRNVQTPEAATPAIDPALVERMWLLVERMAQADKREIAIMGTGQREAYEEARDILKALEPVDEDEEEVERVLGGIEGWQHVDRKSLVKAAIRWKRLGL